MTVRKRNSLQVFSRQNTSQLQRTSGLQPKLKLFLSVTAHYVADDMKLTSAVLQTVHMTSNHTAENIAAELTKVIEEYSLTSKIVAIVSDNAANMTAAVRTMGIRHLPCFAHTLNLIVRAAIQETEGVTELQTKVKKIVEYFHKSILASDRLKAIQLQQGLTPKKLVNDVETRWNSTLLMLQRILEQKDSVTATLSAMGRGTMCLSDEDVERIAETISALKPFLQATEAMSAEKTTTLGTVVPLARSLLSQASKSTRPLSKSLEKHMLARKFNILETFHPLAHATLIDPRYKKISFKDIAHFDQTKGQLLTEMAAAHEAAPPDDPELQPSTSASAIDELWQEFDEDVSASVSHRSNQTEAQLEFRRYLEDKNLPRGTDPMQYWSDHARSLPMLAEMSKKYLCIPATSVPSERLFSKAGELVSARRNRLKPKHIDMFLFLNRNM